MRIMSPEQAAYVAGIIDGEGYLEFGWKKRTRHDRKNKPVYETLNVRLEVPQVDGRLIDYLIETTAEGQLARPAPMAGRISRGLPNPKTSVPLFNC